MKGLRRILGLFTLAALAVSSAMVVMPVAGAQEGPGTISVVKVTDPSTPTDQFVISLDGSTQMIPGDGSTPAVWGGLAPGSYVVTEATGSDEWELSSVSCVSELGASYAPTGNGVSIELRADEAVSCTFVNTAVDPSGSSTSSSSTTSSTTSTSTSTTSTSTSTTSTTSTTMPTTTTSTTSTSTTTTTMPTTTTTMPTTTTPSPRLKVTKETTGVPPELADQEFIFQLSDGRTFQLKEGESTTLEMEPGAVVVSEVQLEGWNLLEITCDDPSATFDLDAASATVTLEADDLVECVFVNGVVFQTVSTTTTTMPQQETTTTTTVAATTTTTVVGTTLPATGLSTGEIGWLGVALLVVGSGVLLAVRRREPEIVEETIDWRSHDH